MLISELITELQKRLELYGDSGVCFRDSEGDMDMDIMTAYYDQDDDKMILTDDYFTI